MKVTSGKALGLTLSPALLVTVRQISVGVGRSPPPGVGGDHGGHAGCCSICPYAQSSPRAGDTARWLAIFG